MPQCICLGLLHRVPCAARCLKSRTDFGLRGLRLHGSSLLQYAKRALSGTVNDPASCRQPSRKYKHTARSVFYQESFLPFLVQPRNEHTFHLRHFSGPLGRQDLKKAGLRPHEQLGIREPTRGGARAAVTCRHKPLLVRRLTETIGERHFLGKPLRPYCYPNA